MVTIAKGRKEAERLLLKAAPTEQQSPQQLKFSLDYLSFFGYVAVELLKNMNWTDLEKAVKAFQKWFGLKPDGVIGPKTLRAMEIPRCGCPDIIDADNDLHTRYARMRASVEENTSRWSKTGLTYAVQSYVSGIPKTRQLKIFAGAFKAWDDVCGLDIRPIRDVRKADLVLSTGSGGRHNFDGRGGTLAWAYLPDGQDSQLSMRFDLAETWTQNPNDRGILLFNVACHEFGHMLGLTHSKSKRALMAPYYNPSVAAPQLDDDIPRMIEKYGKSRKVTLPPSLGVLPAKGGTFHIKCSDLAVEGYELVRLHSAST
jgi:hypothetical protein